MKLQERLERAAASSKKTEAGSKVKPGKMKGHKQPEVEKPAESDMSENEENEESDSEHEELSEGCKLGRLRRLCERKPSGKLRVPEHIHAMWKRGGHDRQELKCMLEEAGWDEDWCVCVFVCMFGYVTYVCSMYLCKQME